MQKDQTQDQPRQIHSIQIILRVLFSQLNRSQQERWAVKQTQLTKDRKPSKLRYHDILEKVNQIIVKHNIQIRDFANVFIELDNNKQISLLQYKNKPAKRKVKINRSYSQIYLNIIIKGQIQVNPQKILEDLTLKKERNSFILSKFQVQVNQKHLIVFLYAQPLVKSTHTGDQIIIKRKECYVEKRNAYFCTNMPVSSSQQLKRICKALGGQKNVRLEVLLATHQNIQKALSMNPTILHFSCHGDQEFLEIESDPAQNLGYADLLLYENLISYIKSQADRKLKFIVFNACNSSKIALQIKKQLNEISTISFQGKVANSACQDLCEDFYSNIFYREKLQNFMKKSYEKMQQNQSNRITLVDFMQKLKQKYTSKDKNYSKVYFFHYYLAGSLDYRRFFLPQQNYLPLNPNFTLIQDKFQIERWNEHLVDKISTKLYNFINNHFYSLKQESLYYWTFGQQINNKFLNKAVQMVIRRKIYKKMFQIDCNLQNRTIKTLLDFKIKHKPLLKRFISENKQDKVIIMIKNCDQIIQSQPQESYEYFRHVKLQIPFGKLILVANNFQRLKYHVHRPLIQYKLEENTKKNKGFQNIEYKKDVIFQEIFLYFKENIQNSQQLLKKALKFQYLNVPENQLFLNPQLRYFSQIDESRYIRINEIDQGSHIGSIQLQNILSKASKSLGFFIQLLMVMILNQQFELHVSRPQNKQILIAIKVQKQQNIKNKSQSPYHYNGHAFLSNNQFQLDQIFFNYLKLQHKIDLLKQINQKKYLKIKLSAKQKNISPSLLFQTLNKLTVIFGMANVLDKKIQKKKYLENQLFNAYKLVQKVQNFNKLKPLYPKNLLQILKMKNFILFYRLFDKLKIKQTTKQIHYQRMKQGKLRLIFSKQKQKQKINHTDLLKIFESQFKKQHELSIILYKIKSLNKILKQTNNKYQTKAKDIFFLKLQTKVILDKMMQEITKLLQYFRHIEFLVKKANQLLKQSLTESQKKMQPEQKEGKTHVSLFSQLQIHIFHLQGFNILSNLMKEIKNLIVTHLSKQHQRQHLKQLQKTILEKVCLLRKYFVKIDLQIDTFNKQKSSLYFIKNYKQLLSHYCWSKLFIQKIYLLLENRHERQTDVFLGMMEKLQLWKILKLQSLKDFQKQIIAFSTSYIVPKCHILVSQPIIKKKQSNQNHSAYRFYNSLGYNIKEKVQKKIDRFANISIQSLTLQKLINLSFEYKKHALNVIFCDSQISQHKEQQKFQENTQNQQIILQNQCGSFHSQKIDKILKEFTKRQHIQSGKSDYSKNNDQTVVNILFGKNVGVIKKIVKRLFQKRKKNIIITVNLSQKQPPFKGQDFYRHFIKTWQCFVEKQTKSHFFTQFFVKFYRNFFIQKSITLKYSLFEQSFYRAKKYAKQSLEAEFQALFPQLKQKNIQFGIQGIQTDQKQMQQNLLGFQKQTVKQSQNHEFFHIKEIGLNKLISQSMKNFTQIMDNIIQSKKTTRNIVIVYQQKNVLDIKSKSQYEQNLKIFVKAVFLMLIKQKKYVGKVSLQMNNSILKNHQRKQVFFNSQNQNRNLVQVEIIYDKIFIKQKKDIDNKEKYYRQRFISSKGQPQKYLKIIVLNCLNKSNTILYYPQIRLKQNENYYPQNLFKTQFKGNIYHFCYPIFKLYKANKFSLNMQKWMQKFVNNPNYKHLLTTLTTYDKENAICPLQYQKIVNASLNKLSEKMNYLKQIN